MTTPDPELSAGPWISVIKAGMRHDVWLPYAWLLLTLPNDLGEYRGHEIRLCRRTRMLADSVVLVQRREARAGLEGA